MDFFCSDDSSERNFLETYNPDKYKKPAVTVDMLIFTVSTDVINDSRKLPNKKLKLLMIKRKNHPFINQWALPGGFVDIDEGIEDAALRELFEETGIDAEKEGIYMEQLYTWGQVNRDPRMRVISVSYISLFNSDNINLKSGDDAEDAAWFEISSSIINENKINTQNGFILERDVQINLSYCENVFNPQIKIIKEISGKSKKIKNKIIKSDRIAFDHSLIIEYGLERLRKKIEYTDLAFNLMPEYFTLTELQQVYEVILGKKLLKANFRRKIDGMVIETGKVKKEAAFRPAKLYRFNPDWCNLMFD